MFFIYLVDNHGYLTSPHHDGIMPILCKHIKTFFDILYVNTDMLTCLI